MQMNLIRGIFFISAVTFLSLQPLHPFAGSFVVKIIPIVCLAFLVLQANSGHRRLLIFLGLLFSAGGDIALDLDRKEYFVIGLSLFLVAHLLYSSSFYMSRQFKKAYFVRVVFVLVCMVIMLILLIPNLDKMVIPVLCYIAAIFSMCMLAALQPGWMIFLGAMVFMLSDSMIAINKFISPIPAANYWILVTYYIGQYFIADGHLRAHN